MIVAKGSIPALAAGTFPFVATLHEIVPAPVITSLRDRTGFAVIQAGLIVTAFVKFPPADWAIPSGIGPTGRRMGGM